MNNTAISLSSISFVAIMGSIFSKYNVNTKWYENIKPNITPPNYVFPIVWSLLYIMLFYVFKNALDTRNSMYISLFVVNLFLNILWTFFYFKQKDVSFAFIIILFILCTSLLVLKFTEDKLIYIPYVLWLWFAAYLNYLTLQNVCLL